mmetsp:Transcript_1685/g.3793  ORF Transcript_1685/g.3793 Transcript_1685/m.3793 type:complete len:225 (+) Transcript_1685:179-853(+)
MPLRHGGTKPRLRRSVARARAANSNRAEGGPERAERRHRQPGARAGGERRARVPHSRGDCCRAQTHRHHHAGPLPHMRRHVGRRRQRVRTAAEPPSGKGRHRLAHHVRRRTRGRAICRRGARRATARRPPRASHEGAGGSGPARGGCRAWGGAAPEDCAPRVGGAADGFRVLDRGVLRRGWVRDGTRHGGRQQPHAYGDRSVGLRRRHRRRAVRLLDRTHESRA